MRRQTPAPAGSAPPGPHWTGRSHASHPRRVEPKTQRFLTHDAEHPPKARRRNPGARTSNTGMAVVPDLNRIPFHLLSLQLFKPYLFRYCFAISIPHFLPLCKGYGENYPVFFGKWGKGMEDWAMAGGVCNLYTFHPSWIVIDWIASEYRRSRLLAPLRGSTARRLGLVLFALSSLRAAPLRMTR